MGEFNIGGLRIGVSLNSEDVARGASNLQKDLRKLGRNLKSIGKDISLGLSAPIAAVGTLSAKAAIDFESAFAGVRKTVDATEKEFATFEKGILDMSKRLPTSAVEIAKVAENAGQLGIQKESILSFTETMVRLGDSTNLSADDASMALAKLANVTNLNQKEFSNLGSSIVALGNQTATTERDIVNMASRFASSASQAKFTHGEILGLAAALSATGVEAEAGGTAVMKTLSKMDSAVRSNAESLKAYSKIAGVDFKKTWEESSAGALLKFVEGLEKINKAGGDVAAALESVGIKEVRTSIAFKNLSMNSAALADAFDIGNESFKENIALMKESDERYKTLASQLSITKNIAFATGVSFGKTMAPAIDFLNGKLADLLKWFEKLSTSTKEALVGFGSVVMVAGPLIVALGSLAAIVGTTSLLIGGGFVLAIAGAVAAAVYFKDEISSAWQWIQKATHDFGEANNYFWTTTFPKILNKGIEYTTDFINKIKNKFLDFVDTIYGPIIKGYNLIAGTKISIPSMVGDFKAPLIDVTEYQKKEYIPTQKAATDETKGFATSIEDVVGQFKGMLNVPASSAVAEFGKQSEEASKKVKKAHDALKELRSTVAQSAKDSDFNFLKENLQGAIDSNASQATIESLRTEIYKSIRSGVEEGFIDSGGVINDESKKLIDEEARYRANQLNKSIQKGTKEGTEKAKDLFGELPEFLARGISKSVMDGIEGGFNSESFVDMAKSAGTIFADQFQNKFRSIFKDGKFSEMLEGGFSNFLTKSGLSDLGIAYGMTTLAQNLSDNKKDEKGGIISGAVLGASIGSSFGPWGTAIGGVAGAGAGLLAGSFGASTNKDTKMRREVVGWIEQKIGGSYLPFLTEQGNIILGDSRRFNIKDDGWFRGGLRDAFNAAAGVSSLGTYTAATAAFGTNPADVVGGGPEYSATPGQIQGPGWGDQYWNVFGQRTGNAFQALGASMSQFSGQAQDVAGQIGVVLAENLIGNLDNARMLLKEMGIGAKELEESFLEIGRSGQQSWHTIEVYMQSVNDLAGEGLVGVGDWAGAWKQLTDSAGRGMSALHGMQNFIIEAQEKGISNLDDLRQAMIDSGEFNMGDINAFFQALEQRGIKTFEQILEGSDRLLGGVVADMESLGFGWTKFNEIANQSMLTLSDLEKKMNELNQKNVDINVSINYEENNKPKDFSLLSDSSQVSTTKFSTSNANNMKVAQAKGASVEINVDARGSSHGVDQTITRAIMQMEDQLMRRVVPTLVGAY